MIKASAPGKVILFGEHAVVYGRPAIAVPVSQVRAEAVVQSSREEGIRLIAPDINIDTTLADAAEDDPLAAAFRQVKKATGLARLPNMTVTVGSQIPVASGLGSGAAISAAIIRAVANFLGLSHLATNEWVSALTYEVERIHHGTPSGIDNRKARLLRTPAANESDRDFSSGIAITTPHSGYRRSKRDERRGGRCEKKMAGGSSPI
jgi:mevalonate kinase